MAVAYKAEAPAPVVTSAAPPSLFPSVALTQDDLKKIAAYKAVEHVRSGMVVGLGTGSTAKHAVDRIAHLLRQGKLKDIVGIPTSTKTHEQAVSLGIPLSDLDSHPVVDLAIDGADEVDPDLNLVKGRGGSLLREKMIESASKKFIVIVDESKLVNYVGGSKLAMPVEVIPFCCDHSLKRLVSLFAHAGCIGELRRCPANGKAYVTDNGNYIIDLYFEKDIGDLNEASDMILRLPGIVEHGMFIGLATSVIVAGIDGVTVKTKVGNDMEVDYFCYNDLRNGF
ncbi:Probable ribose-5-phosphate isomerase 1 [Striga hermonthica]|uniref:ribose-5-phosphate isomerase n=1 Tax=Striga hermonthica TaxID=68872 RepID=A0A9N7NAE3_STRHE|nr:Probable ribose-5-phosphate isomerase 1 [Striga hermonthica]